MEIPIDISEDDRTDRQNRILGSCYKAVEILKEAGIIASVKRFVVTSEKDDPAGIFIDEEASDG